MSYRSLMAPWVGGAGADPDQGFGPRSLLAFWMGGAGPGPELAESTGSGAITLPAVTLSGDVWITGNTGAITLPAITVSGSGVREVTGEGGVTLPSLTVSGTAFLVIPNESGFGAIRLPSLTVSGDGTVYELHEGTGDVTLPSLRVSGEANVLALVTGSGGITLPSLRVSGTNIAREEQNPGGWNWWLKYEREQERLKAEREALQDAIDAEIASLIRGEEAPPAESVAPEYVSQLRSLAEQAKRQKELRVLVEEASRAEDELARLIRLEAAIRRYRRQVDEESFIQMLLMAL